MPWPKTGATHYHAQLVLPGKVRASKGLVVCNIMVTYGPAKRPGPWLLSTTPLSVLINLSVFTLVMLIQTFTYKDF